jgi:hypothetical protein
MLVHSAAAVAQVDWGPVAVWVGALTTFLTVVVALLGGLGWFSLPRRPELRMTFEQAQPWCRQVGTGRDPESLWVRVAVQNDGVDPARGCIGRLSSSATDHSARSDIDPVQLRWAGVPRSRSFDPVDLRRGQREFLNVVYRPHGGDWLIDTFRDPDFDPGFATHLGADQVHVLQVALFADNADTRALTLRLEVADDGPKITRVDGT